MNRPRILSATFGALLLLLAQASSAALIHWDVEGSFDDNTTFAGRFTVDSASTSIIDWDIQTQDGPFIGLPNFPVRGTNYTPANSNAEFLFGDLSQAYFSTPPIPIFNVSLVRLRLNMNDLLTLGTAPLAILATSREENIGLPKGGAARDVTAGTATPSIVPLPPALALFAVGLVPLLWARRRVKTSVEA